MTGCRQYQRNNGLEVPGLYKMKGTKDEVLKIEKIILEYILFLSLEVLLQI